MPSYRCFLGIVLSIGFCVLAPTDVIAQTTSPANNPSHGQFILLDNDQVLVGTAFRQGKSVIVRRGNEAQLTLRANRVVAVADDLPQLYEARIESQRRRSSPSVAQRIGDVRWCIDNNLPAHATEALMGVYAVAPDHPVAVQLQGRLRRLLERSTPPAAATADAVATAQFRGEPDGEGAVQNVSHREPETAQTPSHLDSETLVHASSAPAALHEFTARVQPILLARCSQCHHPQSDPPTNWNLVLPTGGALRVTQRATLANLSATKPFCDPNDPEQSPLIQKAIQAHGGSQTGKPPIAEHEAALTATLIHWITTLSAPSKRPSESGGTAHDVQPAGFMTSEQPTFPPLSPISPADVASSLAEPTGIPVAPEPAADPTPEVDPGKRRHPSRLPTISNPNDVDQFNRETRLRRRLGLH